MYGLMNLWTFYDFWLGHFSLLAKHQEQFWRRLHGSNGVFHRIMTTRRLPHSRRSSEMRQAFSWADPDCSERGLASPAYVLFQSNEMEYPMLHLKALQVSTYVPSSLEFQNGTRVRYAVFDRAVAARRQAFVWLRRGRGFSRKLKHDRVAADFTVSRKKNLGSCMSKLQFRGALFLPCR